MTYAMLAWYHSDVLDEVPSHLTLDPAFEADEHLTFRDSEGTWWRPRRDGSWLLHSAAGWQCAVRPASLEGVAPLPIGVARPRRRPTTDETTESPAQLSPTAALERCVDRVRRSYRAGEVVSTMAELYLADRMLLTDDGRLWTVGARSGSWYVFGERAWEPAFRPPDGRFVAGDETGALVSDENSPARRWADQGLRLPEPLTSEWQAPPPPDSFEPLPLPPIDEPAPE